MRTGTPNFHACPGRPKCPADRPPRGVAVDALRVRGEHGTGNRSVRMRRTELKCDLFHSCASLFGKNEHLLGGGGQGMRGPPKIEIKDLEDILTSLNPSQVAQHICSNHQSANPTSYSIQVYAPSNDSFLQCSDSKGVWTSRSPVI